MLPRINHLPFALCFLFLLTNYASSADGNLAEKVKNDIHEYNDYSAKNTKANVEKYRKTKAQEKFEDWKKAAEAGIPEGQVLLGICYFNGAGVAENKEESVKWLRKAAEQGNADAQYALGVCYVIGIGVPKDTEESVKWFHKAAAQEHAQSQYYLGTCYFW